jgi:dipeptidyl aminopeptidase/acylaminoacyl peptidase
VVAIVLVVAMVLAYAGMSFAVYDGLSKATGGCWAQYAANTPDAFTVDAKWGSGLADAYRMPRPRDVVFHSRDTAIATTRLAAWWIPADGVDAASAPAVVVVHGIKSCRRESSVLLAAGMLHKHGYSVFIMDMRNHGDSGFDADHRVATGSDEYLDILGGWDWVRSQGVPAARIGIAGFSFGSGVALIAGGEEPAVRAVWADSAYTTTERALGLFLKDQTGLPDVLVPGAVVWGKVNGIDFLKFDPITEVTRYPARSLAFTHGAQDRVLPASMATTLATAATAAGARVTGPWVVDGAGHTEAVYRDPAGYEARIVAFFDGAIGPAAG